MIGSFGDIVFETNDQRILTFNNLNRDSSTEYAVHKNIGRKPTLEYVAPNTDKLTFTMILDATLGVKPRDIATRLIYMCRDGEAHPLIIGTWALGLDMWVITNLGSSLSIILNDGGLLKATLDVTLEEYISDYD